MMFGNMDVIRSVAIIFVHCVLISSAGGRVIPSRNDPGPSTARGVSSGSAGSSTAPLPDRGRRPFAWPRLPQPFRHVTSTSTTEAVKGTTTATTEAVKDTTRQMDRVHGDGTSEHPGRGPSRRRKLGVRNREDRRWQLAWPKWLFRRVTTTTVKATTAMTTDDRQDNGGGRTWSNVDNDRGLADYDAGEESFIENLAQECGLPVSRVKSMVRVNNTFSLIYHLNKNRNAILMIAVTVVCAIVSLMIVFFVYRYVSDKLKPREVINNCMTCKCHRYRYQCHTPQSRMFYN